MADMDTYDGEQRGYEGNYRATPGGYYRHSEEHPDIQYHYDLYILKPRLIILLILTFAFADDRDYGRERSRSPGPDRDGDTRIRDEPMNGRGER